jgi:hypothetical protein
MLWRVAAFVSPRQFISSESVANHISTLLACDNERIGTLSTYVSEPRMAIAAAELWNDEKFFSNNGIQALQNALLSGTLSLGIRGEVVAQIILLLAFDKVCSNAQRGSGEFVLLKDVLVELLPPCCGYSSVFLEGIIPRELNESKVACCQFMQVAHKFTKFTLTELAERHAGASLKGGQCSADLVIPIIADGGPACFIFQIKNLTSCQHHTATSALWCRDMLPSRVFAEDNMGIDLKLLDRRCARVLMQVGATHPSATRVGPSKTERHLPQALEIFGIMPSCIYNRSGYIKALKILARGSVYLEAYTTMNSVIDPHFDPTNEIERAFPFVIDRERL